MSCAVLFLNWRDDVKISVPRPAELPKPFAGVQLPTLFPYFAPAAAERAEVRSFSSSALAERAHKHSSFFSAPAEQFAKRPSPFSSPAQQSETPAGPIPAPLPSDQIRSLLLPHLPLAPPHLALTLPHLPLPIRLKAKTFPTPSLTKARRGDTIPVTVTAYCLQGSTQIGTRTREGVAAADPKVFPMHTEIDVSLPGKEPKRFRVEDTGMLVKGHLIDIWTSDCSEALNFGRKKGIVTLAPAIRR